MSEDLFLCSICLEVFTDPVSTPCGHNFCQSCIALHWSASDTVSCPLCKRVFETKPELHVNTFINEMMSQLAHGAQQKPSADGDDDGHGFEHGAAAAEAGDGVVLCDVCTGTRTKALKSCLVCQTSYCESHLQPHRTKSALKRHQLIEPEGDLELEGRMCPKHDRPLELFCQKDQTCVCMLCSVLEHKNHQLVPLREEAEAKKAELEETEAEVQQRIQRKRAKMEEISEVVRSSREAADREKEEGVKVFSALVEAAKRGLEALTEDVERKHKDTEKWAESLLGELEQETCELLRCSAELKQLSRSNDPLLLIQSSSALKAAAPAADQTEVGIRQRSYEGSVLRAVTQLGEAVSGERQKLGEAQLRRVQEFAVNVTLDPDSAHPLLHLSKDLKQVYQDKVKKNLSDKPERFSIYPQVVAKQSFSSGRFYFEVQVKDKITWIVGVVSESVKRKVEVVASPQHSYWTLRLSRNQYSVFDPSPVKLCLQAPLEKLGVFVDYEEGLVSFYNADAGDLIYSYTGCSFSKKLLPYFYPGNPCCNSAPLIICPVIEIGELYDLPALFES